MLKFLNQFSLQCTRYDDQRNEYLEHLFLSFARACSDLPTDAFINKKNNRFNIALYEATFAAACEAALNGGRVLNDKLPSNVLQDLETDETFTRAALEGTTRTSNVKLRLDRAREVIGPL